MRNFNSGPSTNTWEAFIVDQVLASGEFLNIHVQHQLLTSQREEERHTYDLASIYFWSCPLQAMFTIEYGFIRLAPSVRMREGSVCPAYRAAAD